MVYSRNSKNCNGIPWFLSKQEKKGTLMNTKIKSVPRTLVRLKLLLFSDSKLLNKKTKLQTQRRLKNGPLNLHGFKPQAVRAMWTIKSITRELPNDKEKR